MGAMTFSGNLSRLFVPLLAGALAAVVLAPWHAPGAVARGPAHQTSAVAPLEVVTANINFGQGPRGERRQLAHLLATEPDVVLLQELRDLDLRRPGGRVPGLGRYAVVQKADVGPATHLRASGILFLKSRFGAEPAASGFRVGYTDVPGVSEPRTRLLPWATLTDAATGRRVAVVSVHMPKAATTDPAYARAYTAMIGSYQALVGRFRRQGLPVVTGGDWNMPLESSRREPGFGPVRRNRQVGLRFNWSYGRPCTETHGGTRRIDGLAWHGPSTRLLRQRCLARLGSDHRPVLVRLGLR